MTGRAVGHFLEHVGSADQFDDLFLLDVAVAVLFGIRVFLAGATRGGA